MYLNGYSQRVKLMVIAIALEMFSVFLTFGLFHGKLTNINGQLNNYESADYSILYVLNYGNRFENECLFPDTDVLFYLDSAHTKRLTVSSVMREKGVLYDLECLSLLNKLQTGEICITQNVAEKYDLMIGDTLYGEFSYSSELVPMIIKMISGFEFDYYNPNIGNGVGVVYLGYNERYEVSSKSKYLLYAKQSKAKEFAELPQIINKIINKSMNEEVVRSQSFPMIIVEILLSFSAVILAHIVFFSTSKKLLIRCYLKGMNCHWMSVVPFGEKLLFCVLPVLVIQYIITWNLQGSDVAAVYRNIPIVICASYSVMTFLLDILHFRRKAR